MVDTLMTVKIFIMEFTDFKGFTSFITFYRYDHIL